MHKSKFQYLCAMYCAAASAACATNSGKKILTARDRMLGHAPSSPSTPFRFDASNIAGVYKIDTFFSAVGHSTLGEKTQSHQEAWRFTATTVDIYDAAADTDVCGERNWHLEGSATLVVEAKPACAERKVAVLAQDAVGGMFSTRCDPIVEDGDTYSEAVLQMMAPEVIAKELIGWNSAFANAPAWLRASVPAEPKESTLATVRNGFRPTTLGSKFTLAGDFTPQVFDSPSIGVILTFSAGQPLTTFWDEPNAAGSVNCHVIAAEGDAKLLATGFAFTIASIEALHPRRNQGDWTLAGGHEAAVDNPFRKNALIIKFVGAPDGLSASCSKVASLAPITADEVKAAFGTAVSFSK